METFNRAMAALLGTPYAEANADPPPPKPVERVPPDILRKFAEDLAAEDAKDRDEDTYARGARRGDVAKQGRVANRDAAMRQYWRDQPAREGAEGRVPYNVQEGAISPFGSADRPYTVDDLSMEQASVLKDMLERRLGSLNRGEGLSDRLNRLALPDMQMDMPNARAFRPPAPPRIDPPGYEMTPDELAMEQMWRKSGVDAPFPYRTFVPTRRGRRT
jgi:hypothetical protein